MSALASLATDASISNEKDTVGQNGPFDSGIYPMAVALAYLGKSDSGAMSLNLNLKAENGRELRQTLWITSGDAKGNKTYYEKNGEKNYLPGFNLANSLCLLTVGKEISALDTEERVVKLYDFNQKKEVPTKVQVITDILGKEIIAAVLRQTVDKNVKNDAGVYVPSGETRDENEIDKFFRARDRMTVAEIRAQAESATFIDTWDAKWTGVTRNRAKGAGAGTGAAGLPGAAAAAAKPTASLFS